MFIYLCIFLGFLLILPNILFVSIIIFDSLITNDSLLDNYEKILNTAIVTYNKMNLMLKPKLEIVSYNCIYYFSLGQIKYNNYLRPYVNQLYDKFLIFIGFDKQQNTEIIHYSFYKHGTPIVSYIRYINENETIVVPEDYELFIASKFNNNDYFCKDICSKKFKECVFAESNIKFLNVDLNYNGINYTIKLCENDYINSNFYIVDNVFDSAFFKYYLEFKLKATNIDYNNFKYVLHLIDHNVNFVELDETQAIILKQDSYEIIKNEIQTTNDAINKIETTNKTNNDDDNFEDDFDKLE